MNSEWMKQLVESDFKVSCIGKAMYLEKMLFAALRRDAWHFVTCTGTDEDGNTNISISQKHVSRYAMAKSAKFLKDFNQHFLGRNAQELIGDNEFGLSIRLNGRFDIDMMVTEDGWPEAFCEQLMNDVSILNKAEDKVVEKAGSYILPRSKTYHKNAIESGSKSLITAIAFEREIHKN